MNGTSINQLPCYTIYSVTVLNRNRVLESVKAGKRLPEARFASLKVATSGQQSVFGVFLKAP